ncbi:MAG: pyruvate dehydrogenase complex E1 component subunit beta [Alphaproteobacteria bacterium]|nr:pyruvate dehydrogenase complex E1 component subunit beta [Alphaproteobacteria bacterium]
MPTEILMPALSPTMEEGKLAKWHVKVGDKISSGDVIAEIETDKATMEVEAVDEGVVSSLLVEEGTEGVKVNAPIAILQGEDEPKAKSNGGTTAPAPKPAAKTSAPPQMSAPQTATVREPTVAAGTPMVTITVREALREAMAEEMRRDPAVFLMGEEVGQYQGAYKISQGLLDEFGPKRVIDTPITEHGFAGLGVGAAFGGLRPIVEFMTWNFAMQAIDQIINSAGKTLYMSGGQMGCPIVFRGPNGAAARVAAQHSQNYASWYAHVPGLKVVAPYFAADAKGLLKAAIRDPNPVIFLENEIVYGRSFEVPKVDDLIVPIGKARVVQEGTDVTLVSYSVTMALVLQAAEALAKEGISAEVIDLRSLRPLDTATVVASVKKTNRIVTVEEGWPICGIASEIATQVIEQAFDYLDAPPARVTGKDVPMPYAANLEKLALPNVDEVIAAAKAVLYRS